MKRTLLLTAAISLAFTSMAQNEQIHVFRNDKAFSSFKAADIKSITHEGNTTGYNSLVITDNDSKVTTIDLSKVDSVAVRATGLPEFHVTLNDYPDFTDLRTDWGKEFEYAATLRMDGNGMYDDVAEQQVTFRGRGNSTWGMNKKPYRFKMNKKASVCGLPKAKTFALIANYIDCSLMRNTVALWTANYLEMPFANHCVPVKVYLNGNYKGQYMLTEKIGIGGGSVDIEETEGMLFELDSNYDENYRFYLDLNNGTEAWQSGHSVLPVMVKDPDLDELAADNLLGGATAKDYFEKWKADFIEMGKAVMNTPADGSLKEYVDLESAANFFIVNSLAGNHEVRHPKSFYLYKASIDDVYHFGPVWDFDWAYTFDGYEGASASQPLVTSSGADCGGYLFVQTLFKNKEFRQLYKQKWDDFVANGYPELLKYMEGYATMIEPTAKENGLLWPADYSTSWRLSESSFEFRKNFEALKTWIEQRINYCNSNANYGIY
jgi:hypothetical protein